MLQLRPLRWLPWLAAAFAGCALLPPNLNAPAGAGLRYPDAATVAQVDVYHGVAVPDPYRWLEDPDSPRVRQWIAAQNQVTFRYLRAIPERQGIRSRLEELWNFERFGVPVQRGGRWFYTRNAGLQNQSVLWVQDGPEAAPRPLLDPNGLSPDGTVALAGWVPSEDGRWLAIGLAEAGSDWMEWRVLDAASGRETGDRLRWIKFSGVSWTHDSAGFFYGRYPEPPPGASLTAVNENQRLYYHRLGAPQEADELVFTVPEEPKWEFSATVTDDGRWLLIRGDEGTDPRARYWYRDLRQPGGGVVPLLTAFDAAYEFVGNEGARFFFRTDRDAPRGRVVAIAPEHPEPEHWQEVIPQAPDALRRVEHLGRSLCCLWLRDARSLVTVHDTEGRLRYDLELPMLGTVTAVSGRSDEPQAFFGFTSFTLPETIYRLTVATGQTEVFRRPALRFEPSAYEIEQVFCASRDGTRIPMFLVRRRDLRRDGRAPTFLYGYGGFNIAITPAFSVPNLAWMEMGGLLAVANLRGGGEYGEEWHQAGTGQRKQNVFDDFIACAEWLVASGWTSPDKLAIGGASNGGLLVGACLAQRPDLFGAALPAVGVLDMLRYHRFTIGWAWASDYGTSDDPDQFRALLAYSPLHNLRPGVHYPATLITTADHDDRVVPAHSFKFAAALQKAQGGPSPVLIRIETRAGHGAGKPTSKLIEEAADRWAFLVRVLGMGRPDR